MVMEITAAADLFAMGDDELTDIVVSVSNPAEIETIAQKFLNWYRAPES